MICQILSILFTGSMVSMTGRLISDRYGSNLPSASNGKLEKFLRFVMFNSLANDKILDQCKCIASAADSFNEVQMIIYMSLICKKTLSEKR